MTHQGVSQQQRDDQKIFNFITVRLGARVGIKKSNTVLDEDEKIKRSKPFMMTSEGNAG